MRAIWTIAEREVHAFFVSPIAYIVLTVWIFFQGLSLYLFATLFAQQQYDVGAVSQTPLTMFFGGSMLFYVVLLVVVPLMTMRLVADEYRTGTLESLLTAPVTEVEVVLGKYLAAVAFWVVLWVPTLFFVWIMSHFGQIDWGVVGASYLGVFGIGLYFMALGLLMSCVARHQLVAGALTFMALGSLFLLGLGSFVFEDPLTREVFSYMSLWSHMEAFSRGIVDSRYLTFDVTVAALAVLLSIRVLQSRRYAS
jgi:ABC-2 type transport system permease protein